MNAIIIISLAALVLYVYKIQRWRYYWENTREFIPPQTDAHTGLSVVVAFRNEMSDLESLLISLQKQAFPKALYEVILVDDHSDDGSDKLAIHYCETNRNFRYISGSGRTPGKKPALRAGILSARHEIIVTTDADAVAGPEWLSAISNIFGEKQPPDMVVGLVAAKTGNTLIERFAETEFLSLIASGAGAVASGHPIYCNGANLAFRKSLFLSDNDPLNESTISGDDTFMLHAAKRSGKRIVLLKSVNSVITVKGPVTLSEFFNQRIRWISKSRHYTDRDIILSALIVLLLNLAIPASLFLLVSGGNKWLFPVLLSVKSATDYTLLSSIMNYLKKELRLTAYVLFSLIYPFSTAFILLAAMFSGYSWKGRYYGSAG